MVEISLLFDIIILIFGILQIILFFKLWGMTNNVIRIKEHIERIDKRTSNNWKSKELKDRQKESSSNDWGIGSRVVHVHSGNQMKIISLNSNGTFVCTKDGIVAGSYQRDELMSWSEWLKRIKK